MKIATSRPGQIALAATLGALLMSGAFAQPSDALPPIQKSGSVEYLSGGIGQDESTAIRKVSTQWPLTLEFAVRDKSQGVFAADVRILVRDAKGGAVLETTSDGPFLLARLAPGHYAVEATFAGKTLRQSISVRQSQPARAVFVWPAGTGMSDS